MKTITRGQISNWLDSNVGSRYTTNGYNGKSLGMQCKGLTNAYNDWLGTPRISAYYARDMYSNADGRYYTRLQNTPSFVPKLGDIAVFDNHTSIVKSANILSFVSLDQNWYNSGPMGSPGAWVKHNYLKPRVMGFLRPVNVVDGDPPAYQPPQSPPTPSNTNIGTYYQIKRGDTFWGLENAWQLPHGRLQALNPTLDPRKLQIGQKIRRS